MVSTSQRSQRLQRPNAQATAGDPSSEGADSSTEAGMNDTPVNDQAQSGNPAGAAAVAEPISNDTDMLDNLAEDLAEEQELERLEQELKKKKRKERIEHIRKELAGEIAEPSVPDERTHKRGLSEQPANSAKHVKIAEPPTYNGKGARELQEFLNAHHLYFKALKLDPKDDATRIELAGTRLRDHAATSFMRYEDEIATWDEFVIHLRGAIKDPASRLSNATLKLHGMTKKPHQKIRTLLNDIEALEQDLPSDFTEEQRKAWHFLNSLDHELRAAILAENKTIESRDQVLQAGQRLEDLAENNRRQQSIESTTPRRGSYSASRGRFTPRGGSPHVSTYKVEEKKYVSSQSKSEEGRRNDFKCRKCGKQGHYAANCLSKPGGAGGSAGSNYPAAKK